ncbi:MAG: tetratricopeptide repeat protein [Candidatus Aminicenantes bacterium]|nr:tetratricopeptide repeat protein [Candidatus Aminicenantes bacterium]
MKKVVKRQLKEDEFVSTMNKILRFFQTRLKLILVGVAAVAAVALITVGVRFIQAQQVKKESRLLSELLEVRSTLGAKPENLAELEKLSGNGRYSRLGYVLLATHWVENGDLEKAKDCLGKIESSPKDFIYFQARDLLAQINVLQNNYEQAVAIYTEVEAAKPSAYPLDAVLFHKAEALEAKGDKPEALALYKRIQEKYPQSYFGYDAAEKARKLEAAG